MFKMIKYLYNCKEGIHIVTRSPNIRLFNKRREGQYLDRKRIRFVRQFWGLTQTELAEKSWLSADENGRIRISQYENGTRVPRKDMLGKISKALHINSMYLNMDDHTEALDFVFTLLDWDRTTDFIIKKETIDKENHYLIDLNTNLFDDF